MCTAMQVLAQGAAGDVRKEASKDPESELQPLTQELRDHSQTTLFDALRTKKPEKPSWLEAGERCASGLDPADFGDLSALGQLLRLAPLVSDLAVCGFVCVSCRFVFNEQWNPTDPL